MDPPSAAASVIAVTQLFPTLFGRFFSSSEDDLYRIRFLGNNRFLRILDLNANAVDDVYVKHVGHHGDSSNIRDTTEPRHLSNELLQSIPQREHGNVRIVIEQDLDDDAIYLENMELLAHFPSLQGYCSPGRGGFVELAKQWDSSKGVWAWSKSDIFAFRPEMFSSVGGAKLLGTLLRKHVKRACVLGESNENLTLFLSCRTYQYKPDEYFTPHESHQVTDTLKRYVGSLITSSKKYVPLIRTSTSLATTKKILLLLHYHSQLTELAESISELRVWYFKSREGMFDSRKFALRSHLLDEITADAYLQKELASATEQFTILIESLIQITGTSITKDSPIIHDFEALATEIRRICTDVLFESTQISKDLNHHLRFLQIRRNFQESNSLWVLSLLATVLLPLGLASSILSMQTRFKELGYLLYDFIGVVLVLLTLVAVILVLLRLSVFANEKIADTHPRILSTLSKPSVKTCAVFAAVPVWGVFLASFMVGMVRDVNLGGRVLGFGLASLVGIGFIGLFSLFLFSPRLTL